MDAGTYYEYIVVNKSLFLIGEDRETTIIDGAGRGTVVYVTSNNTTIMGFSIRSGGSKSLDSGVYLDNSINVTIYHNHIKANKHCGIYLWDSSNNTIVGNNLTTEYDSIYLLGCSNNTIVRNDVTSKFHSIYLSVSSYNKMVGNNIAENKGCGVYLDFSSNNTIAGNNITNNSVGIYIYNSSYNKIYHNNFIDNHVKQVDSNDSLNVWDKGLEGNYWSDYDGKDIDRDGVGDTPYLIDGNNQDNYPLMNPWRGQYIPGDLSRDYVIDIVDIAIAAKAFGSYLGHPRWNPIADINGDFKVNVIDVAAIATKFGWPN